MIPQIGQFKSIELEQGITITDQDQLNEYMALYDSEQFKSQVVEDMVEAPDLEFKEDVFDLDILKEAIRESNFNKALGEDWMCGSILTNDKVGSNL